jgi:NAD(P)-dependent dehydrogenase (short-subunit alcohol dehydrogenase family)
MVAAKKIALVTGASSGFGQLTAERLAANGWHVFGTSRQAHPSPSSEFEMLVLDVRDDASVQACVAEVLERAGRLDLLVNNAGFTHVSVAEETELAVARDVMETNFWGAVRVINAVLPTMRKQRSGRIINVSSLAGLVGAPAQAFYTASKYALEGYSEALSLELHSFGIHVSLIEPGFFRTNIRALPAPADRHIAAYDDARNTIALELRESLAHGGDPQAVADAIARIAASKSPRLRYRIGTDAIWIPRLKAILPNALFFARVRKRFGLR